MSTIRTGECYYGGGGGGGVGQCSVTINVGDPPSASDTGLVVSFTHVGAFTQDGGGNSAPYGSVTASADAGIAVEACAFGLCNFTVAVTGNGTTVTASSGTPFWTAIDKWTGACPGRVAGSPIIIDTAGEGFQLTDAEHGVMTDMVIPGHSMKFAWTKPESHNAFLWLDGHLFGNMTPQPPSDDPNGFAALAVYDSNHDNVIDDKDAVFPNLRLWIDANHDGVAQPQELFTLPSLGVYGISLHYKLDKYADANGNLFRYRGHLQKEAAGVDRTIYDVFLTIPNTVAMRDTLQ